MIREKKRREWEEKQRKKEEGKDEGKGREEKGGVRGSD